MEKRYFRLLACAALSGFAVASSAQCSRFSPNASSAFDTQAGRVTLPWRTDLPADPGTRSYPWQQKDFTGDWKGYIASVLDEAKASGITISNGRIAMSPQAEWWIAPWMDFGTSGRERINGLTQERGPDAGDLSPTSLKGYQTWAIGWYARPGAFGLGQIWANSCDPAVPSGWKFPAQTASFKLLFSTADTSKVTYLGGAPEVEADTKRNGDPAATTRLKLIQVDIAVRDPNASATNWVMGTFVWRGPARGDGFFDNLVPVGLMWGNDPGVSSDDWASYAPITQSRINQELAGVTWEGGGVVWPQRPYPGFQGRLNGPADNLRSSCLSCHAMAQWRRGPLGLTPSYQLQPTPTPAKVHDLVQKYFSNTLGGSLIDPSSGQTSLDYSLQLEASFTRLCDACEQEKLSGATPHICTAQAVTGHDVVISRPTCEKNILQKLMFLFKPKESDLSIMPRQ